MHFSPGGGPSLNCCFRLLLPPHHSLDEAVSYNRPAIVIFEGIHALLSEEHRSLYDMKLYVDLDSDTRLSRRGTAQTGNALFRIIAALLAVI